MDAWNYVPPIPATVTIGNHWTYPSSSQLKLVVSSLHIKTPSTDSNVPFESLIGLTVQFEVSSRIVDYIV